MVLGIGLPMIVCGIIALFKQKLVLDDKGRAIMSEVNIPRLGKIKTNLAAGTEVDPGFGTG
jgi:hypothetical protein